LQEDKSGEGVISLQCLRYGKRIRRLTMKGYSTDSGYMGYVDGRYILFCSEGDFLDYFRETQEAAADSLEEAA
jgi:hypothetical protein